MSRPIGILVNPRSGGDLRRATENISDVNLTKVTPDLLFTEEDSTRAAVAMREAGCAAVAVPGGDGTNRAVAKGWPDIPVIAVSTGTNNAFPEFIEPTVPGTALALVSQGAVSLPDVSQTAKLLHITIEDVAGGRPDESDIALIDAVVVADRYVGSMELFDPDTMRMAVRSGWWPRRCGGAGPDGARPLQQRWCHRGPTAGFGRVGDGKGTVPARLRRRTQTPGARNPDGQLGGPTRWAHRHRPPRGAGTGPRPLCA